MKVLTLQRLLIAVVATSPFACSSSSSCPSPAAQTTAIYSLALLADAGPATSDAGAGTCQEACERLATFSTVLSCRFTTLAEKGMETPAVECHLQTMCEGRRPEGFRAHEGAHFAVAAQLEAASVFAFAHLAHELRHHRAPRRLIAAARRSRRDEIRHARATKALARTSVPRVAKPKIAIRDLETIAIENAVEGCVRETFGAATAWDRALHAADPNVRAIYKRIARDETKHAALAIELDRWLRARLTKSGCERVERARADALRELPRWSDRIFTPTR